MIKNKIKLTLIVLVTSSLVACFSPFFIVGNLQAPFPPVSVSENETFNIYLKRGTSPDAEWRIKSSPDPQVAVFVETFNDLAFATSTGYRFKSVSKGETDVVFELVQDSETLEKSVSITVTK